MTPEYVKNSIGNAMKSFRIAENELNRPVEDSVPLCACMSTRECMNRFLQSYLMMNKLFTEGNDLNTLLSQCSAIDPRFLSVDLRVFQCAGGNHDAYCLSI